MNSKIKKIIVIGLILVLVLIIGFCVLNHIRKSYDVEEVLEEKYFLLLSNDNMGVINDKGNIVINPQYYDVHIPNPSKPIFVCYYDYNQETGTYRTKIINDTPMV